MNLKKKLTASINIRILFKLVPVFILLTTGCSSLKPPKYVNPVGETAFLTFEHDAQGFKNYEYVIFHAFAEGQTCKGRQKVGLVKSNESKDILIKAGVPFSFSILNPGPYIKNNKLTKCQIYGTFNPEKNVKYVLNHQNIFMNCLLNLFEIKDGTRTEIEFKTREPVSLPFSETTSWCR